MDGPELKLAAEGKDDPDGYRGDRAFCVHRKQPLLIIHLFRTNGKTSAEVGETNGDLQLKDPVVSLSFALPDTNVPAVARTYHVNKVYVRQMDLLAEADDDEEAVDAGNV